MNILKIQNERKHLPKAFIFYVVTATMVVMLLVAGFFQYKEQVAQYRTPRPFKSITQNTTVVVSDVNYIPNSSLAIASRANPDRPALWDTNSWGQNTASFTYLSTGHSSNRSLKVQITKYTSGDAKWKFAPFTLRAGQEYQYIDYYKSDTASRVVVMYANTDGSTSAVELRHALASTTAWAQYKDSFMVPPNTKSVSVFHLLSTVGSLTTSDFSVMPYVPAGFDRPLVTLTFDNGYEVNITTVLPKLNLYGFKSTQYISPAYLLTGQQKITPDLNYNDYIETFYRSGHEIASHTWDHANLTTLNSTDLTDELVNPKQYFERTFGMNDVPDFALPFGAYNERVLAAVEANYESNRTVDPGFNSRDNFDRYRLKVQNMLATTTQAEVRSWLDEAKQNKTWLILVYHRVTSNPGRYDTALTDFGPQMQAVKDSGVPVVTIKQGLGEVQSQLGS